MTTPTIFKKVGWRHEILKTLPIPLHLVVAVVFMIVELAFHTSWNDLIAAMAAWSVLSGAARQTHDSVVFCSKTLLRQRRVTLCTTETVFMPVAAFVAQLLRDKDRRCLKGVLQKVDQTPQCTSMTNLWIHRDRPKALGAGVGTILVVAVDADQLSLVSNKSFPPEVLATVEAGWAVCHCLVQM